LKILFLSHTFSPNIGGIESVSEMLADAFHEAGHEIHLLTRTKNSQSIYKVFNYIVIREPTFSILIKEILWCDVIFENNPSLRMSWPNLLLNKPIVTALHTWIGQPGAVRSHLSKLKLKLVNRSTNLIACSEAIRLNTILRAVVVTNPYDNVKFDINHGVVRTQNFIFLGRLVSDKGVKIAVEAFKIFSDKVKDRTIKFTIVGDGPEKPFLQKLVSECGLQNDVIFRGSLRGEELSKCLNEHQFLIVPSLWQEPFGIVALEAMACGCIPIVSEVGGLPEAVGNAGLTFKRADVTGLANVMLYAYDNADVIKQLQSKAKTHLDNHLIDIVAERYLSVINNAIKKN